MQRPRTSQTNGRKANTSQTSQKWTFTWHNPTAKTYDSLANFPEWVRWVGYGKEVCPTTGTPHLQGFLVTWDPVRLTKFKHSIWAKIHMEICRGTFEQNETYCNKDKDWTEHGERPQQGSCNDILGVKRRLDEGTRLDELMDDEAFFATVMRNERSLRKYEELKRGVERLAAVSVVQGYPHCEDVDSQQQVSQEWYCQVRG